MWDGFHLPGAVRHEMRGFGETPMPPAGRFSHAEDLIARLEGPSALVGASFGGFVCLEAAGRRPDLVGELVVLDAPLFDHEWSSEIERFAEHEEELLEQGELRAAALWNAEFWLEDPSHREFVAEMQERAFVLQSESEAEEDQVETIDLAAIEARTLVGVGELDKRDFHRISERIASEIPDARHVVIEGAGHLPSLERPGETLALVRGFLGS